MSSRVELYKTLRKQVAKELGEKPNTEIVKHVATLRLMRENLQIRLLAGERVDPLDVLKLDEALKKYLPQGAPLEVNVRFVDGDDPAPDTPPPTPAPSPPTPADTKPPAPSAPTGNVVPIRRDPGSIHDQPGVPLKRLQNEPWRGHVLPNLGGGYSGSSPFSAGPMPNFEQHHPLLSPYEKGR